MSGALLVLLALGLVGIVTAGAASPNKLLVIFGWDAAGNNYVTLMYQGMHQEAAKLGYTLKIIENPFDQTVENSQVLQYLSTGTKPAAYAIMPFDANASLASLQKLDATGVPVIQSNVQPTSAQLPYIKFYTGTSFTGNGVTSAQAVLAARKALQARGVKLHSKSGNLVVIAWPQGEEQGIEKLAGLKQGLGTSNPPSIIDTEYISTNTNAAAFTSMNTAIARVGSKGIDLVYGMNDMDSDGAIPALKAAGDHPGQNMEVMGGNCFGDFDPLVSGQEFSTMIVAGQLEGEYLITTLAQYLTDGHRVLHGTYNAPATADTFPKLPAEPYQANYLPQPALIVGKGSPAANEKVINAAKLWGVKVTTLCGVAK